MQIGPFWDFDLRSVHNSFSDADSRISDTMSITIRTSCMIPTPYQYLYMGFGIHQPYGVAYGGDFLVDIFLFGECPANGDHGSGGDIYSIQGWWRDEL